MKVGNLTISLVISNNCFKYAPKWMVSSLIFQKFSGEGLTEPPPQTPPPLFLGLRPRFGLCPQFSGASRPRYSGASRPRFGLRPKFSIEDLGLAIPQINFWIAPAWNSSSLHLNMAVEPLHDLNFQGHGITPHYLFIDLRTPRPKKT